MKREEAIQIIRKANHTDKEMKALEILIPELRESEDERTRKALIQFLNDIKSISESGRTSWAVRKEDAKICNGFITYLEKQERKPIKVYRVENEDKQKGLWRKFDGTWEPLFDMLTDSLCRNLPMEDSDLYRAEGKKWFASAPSRETLQKWFSKRDLEELTAAGFTISEFEVTNYKKVSDFEYIFTRDSIISRTYLKVSDIYPQEQPEMDLEKDVESWFFNKISSKINVEHTMYHYFQECARRYAKWGVEHAKKNK